MALQIRRGTSVERLTSGVVPAQGEFLYTTDDRNLYVGDGVTPGGILTTGKIGAWTIDGAIDNVYLITQSQRVGGYAYFHTNLEHGLTEGDSVTILDSPNGNYDGTFIVDEVINTGEFRVAQAGIDLAANSISFVYTVPESPFEAGSTVVWNDLTSRFEIRPITKADVGLDQVDNTSDINKPISTAVQSAIDAIELQDLSDVNLGTLADGDALVWDSFTGKWINGEGGGGGTASFPETYYSLSGIGQAPDLSWIGTNTMFQYKSDTYNAYKGTNQAVYQTELLTWQYNFKGIYSTDGAYSWSQLNKVAGDWAVPVNPQLFSLYYFFTYTPTSKKNSSIANWAASSQEVGQHTYGQIFWAGELWNTGFYMDQVTDPNNLGQYWLNTDSDLSLYGANPPISTPTVGSATLQVKEYQYIYGWPGSYQKMGGPVEGDYANTFAATSDGWEEIQWTPVTGIRYYPSWAPTGTNGVTIPWTWTFAGTVINKLVVTSTGSIVFLPASTSAFQFAIDSSADNKTITERWSATDQWILALADEPGADGVAEKVLSKIQGNTGSRSLTIRLTKTVLGIFKYRIEFSIHEGDNNFQIVCSPIETIAGKSIQDTLVDYPSAADLVSYLGSGIVKGGEYATHLGYSCDAFGMNLIPNAFEDDLGRVIQPGTIYRQWLEPILDGIGDINRAAGLNSILIQTEGQYPYRFISNRIGRDFLSDIGHNNTILSFTSANDSVSTPNGNGQYYWYRDTGTSTSRLRVYRYDANINDLGTSSSGYIKDKNYTTNSAIDLEIGNVTYSLLLSAAPTWTSSPGYWEFRFKNTNTDGATLYTQLDEINIGKAKFNTAPSYSPIFRYETTPSTGEIFRWNGTKWLPASRETVFPTQTSNSGKYLTTNGSVTSWADPFPTQATNSGKYLTTNGTAISWSDPLPSQSGQTGKYLTTNGTSASWSTVSINGPSRVSSSVTTSSLGPGATANATFTGIGSNGLFAKVTSDKPAWIRFYSSAAARTADIPRLITEDPALGGGVFLEIITSVNNETVIITPATQYFNDDSIETDAIYAAITNQDSTSGTITVTVTAYFM